MGRGRLAQLALCEPAIPASWLSPEAQTSWIYFPGAAWNLAITSAGAKTTVLVLPSGGEELHQDRGEHARVHLMRLTLQHPQLTLRDRLAQHPRRVGHERQARVARHHEGEHRDTRGQPG